MNQYPVVTSLKWTQTSGRHHVETPKTRKGSVCRCAIKLFNRLLRQWMLGHRLQDGPWRGDVLRAIEYRRDDFVHALQAGGHHLHAASRAPAHFGHLRDERHTITQQARRTVDVGDHVARAGFAGEQHLRGRKDRRHGAGHAWRESRDDRQPRQRAGNLYSHMIGRERMKLFRFSEHRVERGVLKLMEDDAITQCEQILNDVIGVSLLARDDGWIGGDARDEAERHRLAYVVEVGGIEEDG